MTWLTQLQLLGDVFLAMLLGGAVGVERHLAEKPAGLRTHMLVAGASALIVGMGQALVFRFAPLAEGEAFQVRADPLRLVEAVVTGLSFLGAGTIFRAGEGGTVKGLTTAASILISGGLGIAVALRQYLVAVGVAALTLIVLRGIWPFEAWLDRTDPAEERTGP